MKVQCEKSVYEWVVRCVKLPSLDMIYSDGWLSGTIYYWVKKVNNNGKRVNNERNAYVQSSPSQSHQLR